MREGCDRLRVSHDLVKFWGVYIGRGNDRFQVTASGELLETALIGPIKMYTNEVTQFTLSMLHSEVKQTSVRSSIPVMKLF